MKTQEEILEKLKIKELNPMQVKSEKVIKDSKEIVLLSPTGTGKTLAFLLPIIADLDPTIREVQVIILVPSRELAIQIQQVIREMGSGYKATAVYGGRSFGKDKEELKTPPAILVGTPGRMAAHLRREIFSIMDVSTLVLDEFDKSLEVGFEEDMTEIMGELPYLKKKILTSATQEIEIPTFVGITKPVVLNYLKESSKIQLEIKIIESESKDKLESLVDVLSSIGNQPGIIFCNFKDTIQFVSDHLESCKISHGCFHGSMEQKDRERALIKFRNGTHQLIIATDLAARGLDIPELRFIIHFQLPLRGQEFTHRNGRTARMNSDGTSYVLKWKKETLPDFIKNANSIEIQPAELPPPSEWTTIFISGGRKDKISKGDIAGLLFKQGKLGKDDVGMIELKRDCAFVAVKKSVVDDIIDDLDNVRLKKKKVRITTI